MSRRSSRAHQACRARTRDQETRGWMGGIYTCGARCNVIPNENGNAFDDSVQRGCCSSLSWLLLSHPRRLSHVFIEVARRIPEAQRRGTKILSGPLPPRSRKIARYRANVQQRPAPDDDIATGVLGAWLCGVTTVVRSREEMNVNGARARVCCYHGEKTEAARYGGVVSVVDEVLY